MAINHNYIPCKLSDIPKGVRFDVPRSCQGQIVEISYGTFGRAEAGPGDPFMCRKDQSLHFGHPEREEYYRLAKG
jgi:hypothetical protein